MSNQELVSIHEACKLLSVHSNTLKRWENEGIVNPIRFGKRGDRKYMKVEINGLVHDARKKIKPYGLDFPRVVVTTVITHKNKILLGIRKRKVGRDYYALPGGYLGLNESFEEASIHEVKEETNLEVSAPILLGVVNGVSKEMNKHTVNIGMFINLKVLDQQIVSNEENDSWTWYPLRKLPEKLLQTDKDLIFKYLDEIESYCG